MTKVKKTDILTQPKREKIFGAISSSSCIHLAQLTCNLFLFSFSRSGNHNLVVTKKQIRQTIFKIANLSAL